MLHALQHFFGLDDLSGPFYGFWSGVGSDITELAIVGGLIGIYRRHTCHARRCWRFGRHPVAGTPYIVCRRHHPDVPDGGATHEQILAHHRRARETSR